MVQPATETQPGGIASLWQGYKYPILLGSVSLLFITISLVLLVKSIQTTTPIEFSSGASPSSEMRQPVSLIVVDIEGAVVSPGVYRLSQGSRVEDAIASAGGLSSAADEVKIAQTINRAGKLSDGAKLYIPKLGEVPAAQNPPVVQVGGVAGSGSVSVNSATQAQLEALPGIGPVTAGKIMAGRPYGSLEELVSRRILTASLYNKLKEQLSL